MTDARQAELTRRDLSYPGLVAGMLAFAGLPLYIHAPRYYADEMGVGLALLGFVLLGARAVDSVQDPLIGRLADRWARYREAWAVAAGCLLVSGFALLFAPPDWGAPLPRLAGGLLAAFTGFSALQIALYDHGLAQAEEAGGGYTRIALWREAGGLAGVCLAALMPAILASLIGEPVSYAGYALTFALLAALALGAMRKRWRASGRARSAAGFAASLRAEGVAPLLAFGFVNALPTAVTSTLFLFFAGDVLAAEAHAGTLLLVFFAAAALTAPGWARLAGRIGRKAALAAGISLSIPAFVGAYALGSGDVLAFYAISLASGAALGADMTLPPAMLAARIRGGGARVFSLWTFLQKTALAAAAGATLPALSLAGYEPGTDTEEGLGALSVAYALVPCALKLFALAFLCAAVTGENGRKTVKGK